METRKDRKRTDKFAAMREIWDKLISNCTTRYSPGEHTTIDEQLLGFRGRCPFRIYIANKPAKYGIKLIMVCDAKTNYMLNALPYPGKHTQPHGRALAHYVTTKLVALYASSKRNITGDNWFTSVPLVNDLLDNYNLTYVGTVRANKAQMPPEMIDKAAAH
ncbi:piggyBac transposable element-derived protein 4-like [Macrobrachium rosenbergii]|uniref:piggyBac transposable element-derived protein 4-like n=1 Tax=Macrobrachium rosenbergii TaxID=79674 RepID=UPI0034D40A4F